MPGLTMVILQQAVEKLIDELDAARDDKLKRLAGELGLDLITIQRAYKVVRELRKQRIET